MNISLLLALTWPIITYPDPRNPDRQLTWVPDMPATPFIQADTARADAAMIGQGGQYQRLPRQGDIYSEVAERFPINEVVPRNQRITVPLEERMAMDEFRTQQIGRETAIRGQMLNQKITEKNFQYENNIIDQAEQSMPLYSRVDPRSPTFDAEIAEINERFPLAPQNQGISQMIGRLGSTRNQFVQDQEIKDRTLQEHSLRQVYRGDVQDFQVNQDVSRMGVNARKIYEQALADGEAPEMALAMATSQAAQDEAIARRQQAESLQTVRSNAPLDARDTIALGNFQQKLLEGYGGFPRKLEELSESERARYDYYESLINEAIQQKRSSTSSPVIPAPQATPTPAQLTAASIPMTSTKAIARQDPRSLLPKSSTPSPVPTK